MRAYAAHTRDYFPFTRKDRTSAFCIVLLFYVRSREWTKSILQTFCKDVAGLLGPRPRFLSSRKERNQRFAKEEVSSLESSLRGKTALCFLHYPTFLCAVPRMKQVSFSELFHNKDTPRELRLAKFSPPVCSANKQMSGFALATSGSK